MDTLFWSYLILIVFLFLIKLTGCMQAPPRKGRVTWMMIILMLGVMMMWSNSKTMTRLFHLKPQMWRDIPHSPRPMGLDAHGDWVLKGGTNSPRRRIVKTRGWTNPPRRGTVAPRRRSDSTRGCHLWYSRGDAMHHVAFSEPFTSAQWSLWVFLTLKLKHWGQCLFQVWGRFFHILCSFLLFQFVLFLFVFIFYVLLS